MVSGYYIGQHKSENEQVRLTVCRVFSVSCHVMLLLLRFILTQLQEERVSGTCWLVRLGSESENK